MTTTVVPAAPPVRFGRSAIAAVSGVAGLLLGTGATLLVVDDDPRPAVARPAAAPQSELGSLFDEEALRIAIQRCFSGPTTDGAAERCLEGLRAASVRTGQGS